jgi:hypothetical protein
VRIQSPGTAAADSIAGNRRSRFERREPPLADSTVGNRRFRVERQAKVKR